MQKLKHRLFPITVLIRWTPDVPMVVPEINPEHFEVIESQKKRLGTTQRIHRSKTKLLHPELCTGSDCMERI